MAPLFCSNAIGICRGFRRRLIAASLFLASIGSSLVDLWADRSARIRRSSSLQWSIAISMPRSRQVRGISRPTPFAILRPARRWAIFCFQIASTITRTRQTSSACAIASIDRWRRLRPALLPRRRRAPRPNGRTRSIVSTRQLLRGRAFLARTGRTISRSTSTISTTVFRSFRRTRRRPIRSSILRTSSSFLISRMALTSMCRSRRTSIDTRCETPLRRRWASTRYVLAASFSIIA